jgi:hypothetical protein
MASREQTINDLWHAIAQGGGKIVSPPDMLPIIFECHLASTLPQSLSYQIDQKKFGDGISISLVGTESRIDPTGGSETHTTRHFGEVFKSVTPHAGFVDYHRYSISLKRMAI